MPVRPRKETSSSCILEKTTGKGLVCPFSHRLTVAKETPSILARAAWVNPNSLRKACIYAEASEAEWAGVDFARGGIVVSFEIREIDNIYNRCYIWCQEYDDSSPRPSRRHAEENHMADIFNVYCDESCHLENDRQKAMALGAIWCPVEKTREIAVRLREIKQKHMVAPNFEIKWTKVSPSQKKFYLDVIDYFFDDDDLRFRCLLVPDKSLLRHDAFPGQNHDDWYYKMYFDMLKVIFRPNAYYRIYLDIKDTCGSLKIKRLHDVLCNDRYDFSHLIIKRMQIVRSHEIEQMQLADLLIGAISYLNRGVRQNEGKIAIIERMRHRSGYDLTKTTLLREEKMNIFRWHATEIQG
jgi:hypothetical protein